MNFKADHEAREIAEIVSKERPQLVMNSNRIVRASKSGAARPNARLRTCDAASSADNTLEHERGEAVARNSQILTQMGSAERLISTGVLKRGMFRVSRRPVDLPCADTVRLPRGGVNIGSFDFDPSLSDERPTGEPGRNSQII